MLWGYYGYKGLCGKYPMPVMKKSKYRLQMTYPIPEKPNPAKA
ncbi:TraU family protein [Orientia tsutsugamushi]